VANVAAPLELVCLFHVAALLEPICLFSLSKATFLLETVSWSPVFQFGIVNLFFMSYCKTIGFDELTVINKVFLS
jgi:hypothetical protein